MGWEDLSAHDDGRPEGFDEPESEPKSGEDQAQAAEETPDSTPEQAVKAEPTEEKPPEGTEESAEQIQTWTLDGGQKVTAADLAKNPDLITRIVTRSNQASNFQRLAEEREQARQTAAAEHRQLLDQYTQWQMWQQQQAAEAQRQSQQPVVQRPATQELQGRFAPHLDQLVADGRLTEDQRNEFGNVISEYMYDHQATRNLIHQLVDMGRRRIDDIEARVNDDIVPDVEYRREADRAAADQFVQQNLASYQGYEALADPAEWNRLKLFIAEKVNASPKTPEGRPSFDPMFDVPTMAQMYDAMTGYDLRQQLAAQKAAQEEASKTAVAQAGGETAARAAGPPPPKVPSKMTPEEEALDFGDPRMASG